MEEILAALLNTHPADLVNVRRYMQWIKIRRQVTDRFYFRVHWVQDPRAGELWTRAHWIS